MSSPEAFHPQREVGRWKRGMMPVAEQTPHAEYKRSLEEISELGMEIDLFDGSEKSRTNIAGEAADVVIRMLGVADSVGIDLDAVVREKILFTTQRKYPSEVIRSRMEQGNTWSEAMAQQKIWSVRWNKHT